MKVLIELATDNDAFDDVYGNGASGETARILRALADRIDGHPHFSPGHDQALLDFNGNEVGRMTCSE